MATFKLEIEIDNAAFDDQPEHEVARVLRDAAAKIERQTGDHGQLHDLNGNLVGSFWTE